MAGIVCVSRKSPLSLSQIEEGGINLWRTWSTSQVSSLVCAIPWCATSLSPISIIEGMSNRGSCSSIDIQTISQSIYYPSVDHVFSVACNNHHAIPMSQTAFARKKGKPLYEFISISTSLTIESNSGENVLTTICFDWIATTAKYMNIKRWRRFLKNSGDSQQATSRLAFY